MDEPKTQRSGRRGGAIARLAVGFLAVVVLSGLPLSALYVAEAPRASMEAIQDGWPWAWMLRGVHYFSGLGLLLTTLWHTAEVVWQRTEGRLKPAVWWRTVALLPLVVGAMLGGFVLRADADAGAALGVWRGLLRTIPGVGSELSTLFLGAGGGLTTVLLHHAGAFTLGTWLVSTEHGRRLWPDRRGWVLAALLSVAAAGLLTLPLAAATGDGGLALGPWYMWGLQGLLLTRPPAVGWLWPLGLVALLGVMRHVGVRGRRWVVAGLCGWLLIYIGFTVQALRAVGAL